MTTDIEEEEVEVVDIDMGDAAKENLRRQHMICICIIVMYLFVRLVL